MNFTSNKILKEIINLNKKINTNNMGKIHGNWNFYLINLNKGTKPLLVVNWIIVYPNILKIKNNLKFNKIIKKYNFLKKELNMILEKQSKKPKRKSILIYIINQILIGIKRTNKINK